MDTLLADAQKPSMTARKMTQTYHDGASRIVYDTDIEHPYPEGKIIISRTDLEGNITTLNQAFVDISGYDIEGLIGQPHSILRHPDMPRAAYKDLWDTAESGQKWHSYVKNLCKDGGHYWVYATVVSNIRHGKTVGYTSVRRQPSRSKVDAAIALYAQMKLDEKQ